jgi:FAD/FMN-containing dehydrogenase
MTSMEAIPGLERISGPVTWPGSDGYEDARRIFNATVDRRPAVIVGCRSVDDVVAAVRAARAAGLSIAVRGGGHGIAGHAMADGALVVDLRLMRSVEVDPVRRRARVQGGALWEDVDRATLAHGLATTGGTFGDTGVGGLTLTGGIGYLMGTYGFSCDNVMRAVVVTADGSVVVAGEGGDPELLWALRGGGGNFGVVTEFEFALYPLGPIHVGGFAVHLDHAEEALTAFADIARGAPPELVLLAVGPTTQVRQPPDQPPVSPSEYLRFAGIYQGDLAAAEAALAPMRTLPGVVGGFAAMTYDAVQAMTGLLPFGLRNYWKGYFLRDLDAASISHLATAARRRPGGLSFLLLESIGGHAHDEPAGGTAFGQRAARWNVSGLGIWEDPADDSAQVGWVRASVDGLRPSSLSGAGYGNYAPPDETAERVRAGFGDERFARLQSIKRRFDPDNVFRHNLNIPPASDSSG